MIWMSIPQFWKLRKPDFTLMNHCKDSETSAESAEYGKDTLTDENTEILSTFVIN